MKNEVIFGTDKVTMKHFWSLPNLVYANDPNYSADFQPLSNLLLGKKKNPFFNNSELNCFVLLRDGKAAARCSLTINKSIEENGAKTAYFGFFETVRNYEIFNELMANVENYCIKSNVSSIEGPFSPNPYGMTGFQTNAFNSPPKFFDTYNPEYYPQFFNNAAYVQSGSGRIWCNENINETIARKWDRINIPREIGNYRLTEFTLSMLKSNIKQLANIFEDAFTDNWHYSTMTSDEYLFMLNLLSFAAHKQSIAIVEYNKEPVAAIVTIHNIYENASKTHFNKSFLSRVFPKFKKNDSLIIFAVGIKKKFRHSTAGYLLYGEMLRLFRNYKRIESTWITMGNTASEEIAHRFEMQPYKEYAVFKKEFLSVI